MTFRLDEIPARHGADRLGPVRTRASGVNARSARLAMPSGAPRGNHS